MQATLSALKTETSELIALQCALHSCRDRRCATALHSALDLPCALPFTIACSSTLHCDSALTIALAHVG